MIFEQRLRILTSFRMSTLHVDLFDLSATSADLIFDVDDCSGPRFQNPRVVFDLALPSLIS